MLDLAIDERLCRSDVRKGFAFPESALRLLRLCLRPAGSRQSLSPILMKKPVGDAKPHRTSLRQSRREMPMSPVVWLYRR